MAKRRQAVADFLPSAGGLERRPVEWFKPDPENPRRWSADDVAQFSGAIRRYGFRVPILCYTNGLIVDGHLRLAAAKLIGMPEVTCIPSDDWDPQRVEEFRLSVNRMGELASWNQDLLLARLEKLKDAGAPLGDDGPIGFGIEAVDEVADVEAWDFSMTDDVHVVTIRCPLPMAAEVRERLRGLEGVEITEDNLELP